MSNDIILNGTGLNVRRAINTNLESVESDITSLQSASAQTNTNLTTLQNNLNTEITNRTEGDTSTLSSANLYTDNAITSEVSLRNQGDSNSVNSAKNYTDSQINQEVMNRNTAIASEATARDTAIVNAVALESVARDNAISSATSNLLNPMISMSNKSYELFHVSNLSVGITDIYTVPVGKQAVFIVSKGNTSGSPVFDYELKIGSTYYKLADGNTLSPNLVLSENEVLAVNVTSGTLNDLEGILVLFDTNSNLKVTSVESLVSGDNLAYTVTSGKRGILVKTINNLNIPLDRDEFSNISVDDYSGSGAVITKYYNNSSNVALADYSPIFLNSGESIVINSDMNVSSNIFSRFVIFEI